MEIIFKCKLSDHKNMYHRMLSSLNLKRMIRFFTNKKQVP